MNFEVRIVASPRIANRLWKCIVKLVSIFNERLLKTHCVLSIMVGI